MIITLGQKSFMFYNVRMDYKKSLIFEGSHSLIFIEKRPEYSEPVIIKVLKKARPSIQEVLQFNNEFEFIHGLNISGIRNIYEKTHFDHQSALILEYIEGQTLKELISTQSFSWPELLSIA